MESTEKKSTWPVEMVYSYTFAIVVIAEKVHVGAGSYCYCGKSTRLQGGRPGQAMPPSDSHLEDGRHGFTACLAHGDFVQNLEKRHVPPPWIILSLSPDSSRCVCAGGAAVLAD